MFAREFENRHPAFNNTFKTSISPDILILAGGKGSRLKNADDSELKLTPKPLVTIQSNKGPTTMIGFTIEGFVNNGLTSLTFLTCEEISAGGNAIEEYITGKYPDLYPNFSREQVPLGTAGAVYQALQEQGCTKTVIITPSDTRFPFDLLPQVVWEHNRGQRKVTWTVTTEPGNNVQNPGNILVDSTSGIIYESLEGKQTDFPSLTRDTLIPTTSTGVIVADGAFFISRYAKFQATHVYKGPVDLYRDFFPWLIGESAQIDTFDIKQPAPDLGTPERLELFGRKC